MIRGYNRHQFDLHARQLVSNTETNADQIISQAKAQADQLLTEVKADAERRRAAAQREVDELTGQKDSIASHLAQVCQLARRATARHESVAGGTGEARHRR